MSEKNKAILEAANDAIRKGDKEGFLSYCTEDTEWTYVGDKTLKGKEAVLKYLGESKDPPNFTVDHLIAEGEYVTALGDITMKDENGQEVQYSYCDVWRFRDDEMAELKAFVIKLD